jgi:hypothetical protein
MKNPSSFSKKSKLVLGFSLVLLGAAIYFGGSPMLTDELAGNDSNQTAVSLSQGTPVNFVSKGDESVPSGTDLVATYSHLYGKYQVKVFANRKFSVFTDQEIEAIRLEAAALDKLYSQMTLEQRTKIKKATFPFVRLEVDGKFTFKKAEDLTPAERKSLNC